MGDQLCPCGKPARRKYCSDKCMWRALRKKDRQKRREYMREYLKQWHARNPSKKQQYAASHRRKVGPEGIRQAYLRVREKQRERAKAYYRENAERIKAKARSYHHANKEAVKAKAAAYRKAHRAELAAKELARYREKWEYMTRWRKENAAKLKAQRQANYRKHRDAYLARQRERTHALDPAKKLVRGRRYTQKQKAKKLAADFSLLQAALANRPAPTSAPPPPPSRPKP